MLPLHISKSRDEILNDIYVKFYAFKFPKDIIDIRPLVNRPCFEHIFHNILGVGDCFNDMFTVDTLGMSSANLGVVEAMCDVCPDYTRLYLSRISCGAVSMVSDVSDRMDAVGSGDYTVTNGTEESSMEMASIIASNDFKDLGELVFGIFKKECDGCGTDIVFRPRLFGDRKTLVPDCDMVIGSTIVKVPCSESKLDILSILEGIACAAIYNRGESKRIDTVCVYNFRTNVKHTIDLIPIADTCLDRYLDFLMNRPVEITF